MSGPESVVGSDHKPIWGDMSSLNSGCRIRRQAWTHRCGKWQVDGAAFMEACNSMAENLELTQQDFELNEFVHVCQSKAKRSVSVRYRDLDDILALVRTRRQLSGAAATEVAVQILAARKRAKFAWLQELLDRAAAGDFRAASYFRKRQHAVSSVSVAGLLVTGRRQEASIRLFLN